MSVTVKRTRLLPIPLPRSATIGPFTPAYWAMRGHRAIFLDGGGVADVLLPVAVLLAAAVVLAVLGAWRFRADETKEFFA